MTLQLSENKNVAGGGSEDSSNGNALTSCCLPSQHVQKTGAKNVKS